MNQERNITYEIAMEYNTRAEAYDRTVCTGPIGRDGIMPANYIELAKIGRFALDLRKELRIKADALGVDWKDVQRYISTS